MSENKFSFRGYDFNNGKPLKYDLSIEELADLINNFYYANSLYFDFGIQDKNISEFPVKTEFKYMFDFLLFNFNQLEQLKSNHYFDNLNVINSFFECIDLFNSCIGELDVLDKNNYPIIIHSDIKCFNFNWYKTSIYSTIERFIESFTVNSSISTNEPIDARIIDFFNNYLKVIGFSFNLNSNGNELITITKRLSKEICACFRNEYNLDFTTKIKLLLSNQNAIDRNRRSFQVKELSICLNIFISKYGFELPINEFDESNNDNCYEFIKLLSDELYAMLLEVLRSNTLSFDVFENFDFSFITKTVFSYCEFHLRPTTNPKSKIFFGINYDSKTRNQLFKYYYLSTFFGNKIANSLEESMINCGGDTIDHSLPYNSLAGFKNNLTKLRNNTLFYISKNVLVTYLNIEAILRRTQAYKHCIIETALYNKALMDYYPIFNGMEYTPLMVNLFKGVEELCCDLIEYLEIDKIDGIQNIKGFMVNGFSFGNDDWQDELTLGSLFRLVTSINKYDIDFNNRPISNPNKGVYDESYIQYFEQRKLKLHEFIDDNKSYFNGFDVSINRVKQSTTASDLLNSVLYLWRKSCRNNCVHKDDTLDKPRVDFTFDFTFIVIAMLIEWAWLLK